MPVLQELQGRSAAGGDMTDFVGQAKLLDGGRGIAAADDRGGALPRGVRDGLGDLPGACSKRRLFEYTHRPVPHDRLGAADLVLIARDSLRADVETGLSIGNGAGIHGARL